MRIPAGGLSCGLFAVLALCLAALWAPRPAQADPVAQGAEHCVINVRTDDVLNLRSRPSAQSRVLTGLRYGQCGVVVTAECRGNWCPVDDGHQAGWAHKHYLGMVSPARYCVTGLGRNDLLALRAYPAHTSRVLVGLAMTQCDMAFLPYARDGWQKIRAAGWEGWVPRSRLSGQ